MESQSTETETELEEGEIEDDGQFLQEIEDTLTKKASPKCILFIKKLKNLINWNLFT